MSDIRIRPFKWSKDFNQILQVAREVWFADKSHVVSTLNTVNFMLHYMNQATTLLVAVDSSDRLMGILGLTNKVDRPEFRKNRFICCRARFYEHAAKALLYFWPGALNSRLFNELFFANYDRLRKMVPDLSAPEFLVMIVNPESKGMGVGRKLVVAGEEILRNQGFKSYYLLTDSSCDYGFYDHLGMTRAVDVNMSFSIRHVPEYDHYLNCFLRGLVYTQDLREPHQDSAKDQ